MNTVEKFTLSVFIIILILVSFGAGFLGRGYYDQILKEVKETKEITRAQFLMQIQSVSETRSTSTETHKDEYKKVLQMREEEAEKIRAKISESQNP